MSDQRDLRTHFSMRALDLSEVFREGYATRVLGARETGYTVELSAPEGPSTGGGAQAMQHIRLVPIGGVRPTRPILAAGLIVQTTLRAELRTYDHLAQILAARAHGAVLPFDRAAYEAIFTEMNRFFAGQGFTVTTELPRSTATNLPVAPPAAPPASPWKWVALAALAALAAFIAVFLTRR